jgi:hypothetical protein
MTQPAPRTYTVAPEAPFGVRLERFLAIGMPMLLLATIAITQMRASITALLGIQFVFFVVSGVALPATGVAGFFDDEYLDVTFALVPTLIFGPAVGCILYLIIAGGLSKLFNLDFSVSVFSLMAWLVVTASVFTVAVLGIWSFEPRDMLSMVFQGGLCSCGFERLGFLGIWLGWFFGGFFRPLTKN